MKNRIFIIILLVFLAAGMNTDVIRTYATEEDITNKNVRPQPTTEIPGIVGETGILIDAKSGMILYNKNMEERREPASTTKMITGLLAIERLPLDKVVTIDDEAPFTGGSRIYLIEGEEITVEQLLYALFLPSANDAAVALAKEMGGTVEEFAVMMNEKARELGAKNTNFINPHGLHSDGHETTSYDLAMIAKGAMKNDTFRKFVSTYTYTIPPTNKQPEERILHNTNRMLYDTKTKVSADGVLRTAKYDGIEGIKTGYTGQAGGTLTSAAKRDGTELIAVVMKSTDLGRFGDSIALLDWGFENYHTVKTIEAGADLGTLKVAKGKEKKVALSAEQEGYATLSLGQEKEQLTRVLKLAEAIDAPVKKGHVVGTVDFFLGDKVVSSVNVITSEAVEEGGLLAALNLSGKGNSKLTISISVVAGVAAVGIGALYLIRQVNIRKRRKRRANLAMEIAMKRELEKLNHNKEKFLSR